MKGEIMAVLRTRRALGMGVLTALATVLAVATAAAAGALGVTGTDTTTTIAGSATKAGAQSTRVGLAVRDADRLASSGTARSASKSGDGSTDASILAVANPGILAPPDVVVGESDDSVDLEVRLSDEGTLPVTVNYATVNASAGSSTGCNADYDGVSGTLTFVPGDTSEIVSVDIFDCPDVERFESFTFELSMPANGVIARASGRVGIVDNGSIVDTPLLFVRDAVVDEKDGVALVPVLLGGPHGQASNSR